MSGINGSADGDLRQQIHQSIDLNQPAYSEPEINSSPSNEQSAVSVIQCSLETFLEIVREGGDISLERDGVVQLSVEDMEDAGLDLALYLQPNVLMSEFEPWTYHAALPPPPSPTSVLSMDLLNSIDIFDDDSADIMPLNVIMGCDYCYMYIITSEADPYCPNCGTDELVDELLENSPRYKRRRY